MTPGQICPHEHGALLPGELSGVGPGTVVSAENVTPKMTVIFHYSHRSISACGANDTVLTERNVTKEKAIYT